MRTKFDQELHQLEVDFLEMSHTVYHQLETALLSLKEKDEEMAQTVIALDQKVNQKELDIELECARMFALQQPVVTDLRFVIATMKAASDLERIGDHATALARLTHHLMEKNVAEIDLDMTQVGQGVLNMLEKVTLAFQIRDETSARQIAKEDNKIDEECKQISQKLLKEMHLHQEFITVGSHYRTMVSRLERMADYVVNICERIVYVESGELIELA